MAKPELRPPPTPRLLLLNTNLIYEYLLTSESRKFLEPSIELLSTTMIWNSEGELTFDSNLGRFFEISSSRL
jgi:hypothetical protein